MTRYTNVKMRIAESQKDKLKKAYESNCRSISIRLTFSDLHGEHVIALTKSQLDRLVEAYEEKKGMTMKILKTQWVYNMKIKRVVGNRAIKEMSLKKEKHEKIAMLAVSALNTTSSLISKSIIR